MTDSPAQTDPLPRRVLCPSCGHSLDLHGGETCGECGAYCPDPEAEP